MRYDSHQIVAPLTGPWPPKTREMFNHHIDSTAWNDFPFRDDDIVVATYAKSGTTWMQQIIGQLVFNGRHDVDIANISPWLDLRVPDKQSKLDLLASQKHRRFIKTHLPVDALNFSPTAKYIFVGRDGRDVVWSLYNHHKNANPTWYRMLNDTPGRIGPAIDPPTASIREYYEQWLRRDGHPFWPFWSHIRSWWEIRRLPNVLLIHFADMKRDLPSQIRRIANFLTIPLNDLLLESIVAHCDFTYMKTHAHRAAPGSGQWWHGGGRRFIYKGTNGRWRRHLDADEAREYETLARTQLGPACAEWIAKGGALDGGVHQR